MRLGIVEIISSDFASGWAVEPVKHMPAHLYAILDGEVVGFAQADLRRDDLEQLAVRGDLFAGAFILVFDRVLSPDEQEIVEIRRLGDAGELDRSPKIKRDRVQKRQIFILGSPRSGTSELGATLTEILELPWLGEVHAAEHFAKAADALTGDSQSSSGALRFMARQNYRQISIEAMRRCYYFTHGSASFLDKTPGTPMIRAASFLAECFPGAYFIYMKRNGIANVLSRVAKFGGRFESHCGDWAAAIILWMERREALPHYCEVDQEEMLTDPLSVATRLMDYLGEPQLAEAVASRLATGGRERTGAGLGKRTLAETGWDEGQLRAFRKACGDAMATAGYQMD